MTPFLRKLLGLNWRLLVCGAVAGAPCLLILMQPDLGEVIIWVPVLLALLFVGGMPLRYLLCILLILFAMIPITANLVLKPYQQARLTAFAHPEIDKQGSSWAINQSLIAIGSGGWSGKGFKAANTQIELGFLPATAVHNDYIFSAIGEQWGFVGGVFLISAFALLLLTCLFVAFFAGDQFGLLLVIGITALIFTHIFQNVGMTISILPITGVPLPLISYSGSFALMIMFELGVMAANLIYLKSRSLLPLDQQPPEEDAEEDDPRWDLIRQLIEYKKFKEAAGQLHDRALEQERIFTRDGGSVAISDAPLPLHEVGIFQLIHAFQEVIKRVEAREDLQEIFGERFSVSDKIEKILERVGDGTPVRFSELFGQIVSRVEIVVTFLALLELIRLNQVRAMQRKMFDEIEIAPIAA